MTLSHSILARVSLLPYLTACDAWGHFRSAGRRASQLSFQPNPETLNDRTSGTQSPRGRLHPADWSFLRMKATKEDGMSSEGSGGQNPIVVRMRVALASHPIETRVDFPREDPEAASRMPWASSVSGCVAWDNAVSAAALRLNDGWMLRETKGDDATVAELAAFLCACRL
jgi:hypothetical protein